MPLKQSGGLLNETLGFFNQIGGVALGTIKVIFKVVIAVRLFMRLLLDDGG